MNKLTNVSYAEMEKFVLDNMEYTYNVKKCLQDEINDLNNDCMTVFEMHDRKFDIVKYVKIENEDTDEENIIETFDIEII